MIDMKDIQPPLILIPATDKTTSLSINGLKIPIKMANGDMIATFFRMYPAVPVHDKKNRIHKKGYQARQRIFRKRNNAQHKDRGND